MLNRQRYINKRNHSKNAKENYGKQINLEQKYHHSKHIDVADVGLNLSSKILLISFCVLLLSQAALAEKNKITISHRSHSNHPPSATNQLNAGIGFPFPNGVANLNFSAGDASLSAECVLPLLHSAERDGCNIFAAQVENNLVARVKKQHHAADSAYELNRNQKGFSVGLVKDGDHKTSYLIDEKPTSKTRLFIHSFFSGKDKVTIDHENSGNLPGEIVSRVKAEIPITPPKNIPQKTGGTMGLEMRKGILTVKANCETTSQGCNIIATEEGDTLTIQVSPKKPNAAAFFNSKTGHDKKYELSHQCKSDHAEVSFNADQSSSNVTYRYSDN